MENKRDIVDESRRNILKKAYVAPAIVALGSMTFATDSSASGHAHKNGGSSLSCGSGNNGWGNGDQRAPGNSLYHNRAENDHDGKSHRKHGYSNSN